MVYLFEMCVVTCKSVIQRNYFFNWCRGNKKVQRENDHFHKVLMALFMLYVFKKLILFLLTLENGLKSQR